MSDSGEITRLLNELQTSKPGSDRDVLDRLIPLVYFELKLQVSWKNAGADAVEIVDYH